MQARILIKTTKDPAAFGLFSQAIKTDTLVFTSGQLPIGPESGELVDEDVIVQTHQVFKNLKSILEEAASSINDVVKATMFITSMDDFVTVNEIYSTYFSSPYPARSCIEVTKLAKWAKVEIEAIAISKE